MTTGLKVLVGIVGSLLAAFFIFWIACLNHVEINEIGVAYNSIGGKIWNQERPGWYMTSPFVRVAYISTLPIRVSIPSEARVINTKIVRFKIEGVDEFIRMQGFSYFTSSTLENILMGYAFSGKEYPFIEIMQEAGPEKVNERPLNRQ